MFVDHIGYLTHDINKAILLFTQMGFVQETEIIVDDQAGCGSDGERFAPRNVYLCFLTNGDYRVELVSPVDEHSIVSKILKKQGDGPYHICYQVSDIYEKIEQLKASGWLVIQKPASAIAFKGGGYGRFFIQKKYRNDRISCC